MRKHPAISVLFVVLPLAACRPAPQAPVLYATPPVVQAYTQFAPGDPVELVRIQLGLDNYAVRYRTSMPEGLIGMVYFLDNGNLHIDAKRVGDTWVLISVPLLDPSTTPAADRVAEWDRGADAQNRAGKGQQ